MNFQFLLYIYKADKTISPERVGDLRNKEQVQKCIEHIRQQPTQRQKKEFRTEYGLQDTYNPLMKLSLDLNVYVGWEWIYTIMIIDVIILGALQLKRSIPFYLGLLNICYKS